MPKRAALADITPADLLRLMEMAGGISTKELAEMLFASQRSVQLWLSGDRRMPRTYLELFLCKTGLSIKHKGRPPKKK